jgi:hypothetical protein
MELDNQTPYTARLFSGNIGDGVKGAWVVARATFRLDRSIAALVPAADAWPIFVKPVATDVGVFPSDEYPYRRGCELVITGVVRAAQPTREVLLTARVGDFNDRLLVLGDRVWVRGDHGLHPSEPRPFTELPLTWAHAYGGAASFRGIDSYHPLNPKGRGRYADEASAEGAPLPNLEDPAARITRWSDAPMPVGWGPVENAASWQLADFARNRAARGEDRSPTAEEMADLGMALNPTACVPRLVMPELEGGASVQITGLDATPLRFVVPSLALRVRATAGARRTERRLAYTGLWVLAAHDLVVLTLRAAFSYGVRAEERRTAVLEVVDVAERAS